MNDVQRNMADEWQTTQHSRELSRETNGREGRGEDGVDRHVGASVTILFIVASRQ